MSNRLKVLSCFVACVMTVGACGGSDNKSSTDQSAESTTAVPTTAALGPTAPLTGLPQPDEALRNRPTLVVKIDNHPEARPQFGVDKADVIVEEKVEAGISRFMALFQSQDSDQVGPVRSLRSTDPAWLKPEGGMIAYSGGIDPVKALLAPNGVVDLGADNHGSTYYKRRSGRPFEHSQYTITPVLRTLTPKDIAPAKPLFTYVDQGQSFGGAGAAPVTNIQGRMDTGAAATSFDWNWSPEKSAFIRGTDGKAHEFEGAGQIAMPNVILQFTPYRSTPWKDRANTPVDEAVVVGSGDAWVLSAGQIIKGRWSRPTASDITTYTDAAGAPIKITRGRTWLSLVPAPLVASTVAT